MPDKEEAGENSQARRQQMRRNKAQREAHPGRGTSISHLNHCSSCSHLWPHSVYSHPSARGISEHLSQITPLLCTESCHVSQLPQVQSLTGSHIPQG